MNEEDRVFDPFVDLPDNCECDNTHEHNDTVCRWCWSHGRRHWKDADVELTPEGAAIVERIADPNDPLGKPVHHLRRRLKEGDNDERSN